MTSEYQRGVGVFASRTDAQSALQDLKDSGFEMDRVSVIARDSEKNQDLAGIKVKEEVGNKADEGAATGAVAGGTLGGITGLLVGLGMLAIPGVGPIMLAGAEATAIATTVAGGAIGAATAGLVGALVGLGIPEERAKVYNDYVAKGNFLIIVKGTKTQINRAEDIFSRHGIQEWGVYDIPAAAMEEIPGKVLGSDKYLVGIFRMLHNLKDAISAIRDTNFPMTQIYIVEKNARPFASINSLEVKDSLQANASLGISKETVERYEQLLERGNYLIVMNGSEEQLNQAKLVLENQRVEDLNIYDPATVRS